MHVQHQPPVVLVFSVRGGHELLLHAVPPDAVLVRLAPPRLQVKLDHGVELELRVVRQRAAVHPARVGEPVLHSRERVVDARHLHDVVEQPPLADHFTRNGVDDPLVHARNRVAALESLLDPPPRPVRRERAVEKAILAHAGDDDVSRFLALVRVDEVVHHLRARTLAPTHVPDDGARARVAVGEAEARALFRVVHQRVLPAQHARGPNVHGTLEQHDSFGGDAEVVHERRALRRVVPQRRHVGHLPGVAVQRAERDVRRVHRVEPEEVQVARVRRNLRVRGERHVERELTVEVARALRLERVRVELPRGHRVLQR